MTEIFKHEEKTFGAWLFSKQEWVEKTAGLIVLTIELISLTKEIFQDNELKDKSLLSHFLNLFFLIFIYKFLRNDFKKKFHVAASDKEVARALRLNESDNHEKKITELVFNSNTFFAQLKNFNSFIFTTAILYVVLLLKKAFEGHANEIYLTISVKMYFHLILELFSYIGAFFLIRCFYVMYLPTVDEEGNDRLNEHTKIYKLLLIIFMAFDFFLVKFNHENGYFISEFICGLVNSTVFILLIGRFGNKILDIPPIILVILYIYAILQTCLPFVTGDIFGEKILNNVDSLYNHIHNLGNGTAENMMVQYKKSIKELKEFLNEFSSIVLTLCLIGKVTFAAVILYIISTGRIFYYFMTLRIIHEQESENWKVFAPKISSFSIEPETFHIIYNRTDNKNYTATIQNLFHGTSGYGDTKEKAKQDLLNKITKQK